MHRYYVLFVLSFIFCANSVFAKSSLVQLKTEQPEALRSYLEKLGFEVEGYSKKTQELGVVTEYPFLLLEQEKSRNESTPFFHVSSITASQSYQAFTGISGNLDSDEEKYLGPDEIVAELRKLETAYPQWAQVYDLNSFLGARKTEEGRSIYALHISSNPGTIEDKPKILILGQHHARELTTQHAVLDTARELLEQAARGEGASVSTVENLSVWLVPVLNPDGLSYVLKTDRMWRKNRAHNAGGTRGVDLNRNYGVMWGKCGMHSAEESSEVYKGKTADSEAEVQLNEKLNQKLHFQYSISYHSYGNEILTPYLCGKLSEANVYNELRDGLKSVLGFGSRPASSSGEDHEFHYNKVGSLAFLLELGDEFQPSFSVYRNEVWPNVKKVLPYLSEQAQNNFVHVKVVDADTGVAISGAALAVQQIKFQENEVRTADAFGSYRWRLPNGSYSLSAALNGYQTQSASINAEGSINTVTLQLKKRRSVFPELNPFRF